MNTSRWCRVPILIVSLQSLSAMNNDHIHIDMPECRLTVTIMTDSISLPFSAIKLGFLCILFGKRSYLLDFGTFSIWPKFYIVFHIDQLHPMGSLINVTVKHVRITKERNINCQNVIHRTYFKWAAVAQYKALIHSQCLQSPRLFLKCKANKNVVGRRGGRIKTLQVLIKCFTW